MTSVGRPMRARPRGAADTDRTVFVYDPMDEDLTWLEQHEISPTLGAPLHSTGEMRPKMREDDLIANARGHRALMGASGARITRRVMEALPELGYISKLGIGCELIDLAAATELGILVTNTPVHSEVEAVAEHTIALMLALLKRLDHYGAAWLRQGGWRDPLHMAIPVRGSTIGIIGFGKIGRAVAQRLAGWDARIIASDIYPTNVPAYVTLVPLDELLRESDVVTIHTPGPNPGQPPLLDDARLALMKPSAMLVNAARGSLVDTGALARRLSDGGLAGAAVDVYDPEPPAHDHPLLSLPNVVLTPHVAAWDRHVRGEMAHMAYENLWEMFEGVVPKNLVNRDVLGGELR